MPARVPDTTQAGPTTQADSTSTGRPTTESGRTLQNQREIARQMAEKIDRIESEMIATALPVPPPPRRVQQRAAKTANGADASGPVTLPPLDVISSIYVQATEEIQVGGSSLPPEVEEAAILFANGQLQAAASTLRNAIERQNPGEPAKQQPWLMLFDVYLSSGARSEFESLSIDFASRFERSPPVWPESDEADVGSERASTGNVAPLVVNLPAAIGAQVERQVEQALRAAAAKRQVRLECSAVRKVDPAAASALLRLLRAFKRSGLPLVIASPGTMFDAMRELTEPGERGSGEDSWMFALEMLRVQNLQTEFDDLSIDYCVTFEMSPPPWEPMPDNVTTGEPAEPSTAPGQRPPAAAASSGAHAPAAGAARPGRAAVAMASGPTEGTGPSVARPEGPTFAFRGEVTGRIQAELKALREFAADHRRVVIDCRDLRRLDFAAAGELLNEVSSLRGQGKDVIIVDPSQIVAALLYVMGIHELADIRKRKI